LLAGEDHSAKKKGSEEEMLIFEKKQQALNIRIEKHRERADRYLPPQFMDHVPGYEPHELDNLWVNDADAEVDDEDMVDINIEQLTISDSGGNVPERNAVFLPSSIGHENCKAIGLQNLVKRELSLRQGEANDALQAIRIGIGEKSFRFRKHLRNSKSKVQKTRSWDAIHAVDRRLNQNCLIYKQSRNAMMRLGAPKAILLRYQNLAANDLHTNTAVQEPNARGKRNEELSWIWKMPGVSLANQETLLHECEELYIYSLCPGLKHFPSVSGKLDQGKVPSRAMAGGTLDLQP
jgi:hypothetical protein